MKMETETGGMWPQAQECLGRQHLEEAGRIILQSLLRELSLPTSGLHSWERTNSCCCKPWPSPCLWSFVMIAP